jgi:hypothetical protein
MADGELTLLIRDLYRHFDVVSVMDVGDEYMLVLEINDPDGHRIIYHTIPRDIDEDMFDAEVEYILRQLDDEETNDDYPPGLTFWS